LADGVEGIAEIGIGQGIDDRCVGGICPGRSRKWRDPWESRELQRLRQRCWRESRRWNLKAFFRVVLISLN